MNRDASLSCRAPGSDACPRSVGEPSLAAGLVAPSGSTQTVTAGPCRTIAGAIDLPTVTTAADQHLAPTSRARSSTRPPRARAAVIWSKIVATICSASSCRRCGLLAASSAMSSAVVTATLCSGAGDLRAIRQRASRSHSRTQYPRRRSSRRPGGSPAHRGRASPAAAAPPRRRSIGSSSARHAPRPTSLG